MMRRPILLIPILLVVLAVSMFLALGIGVSGFSLFTFETEMIQKLLFEVRLPRIIAAVLVGAGLAAAGCAMQGLFRNPMASLETPWQTRTFLEPAQAERWALPSPSYS